jgi:Xaa-Pro aminopeptidase
MTEFETKQARLRALLAEHRLDALLLRRVSSFAWATCGGASYINTADSHGVASLLITPTACHLITNNIEAVRLEREEELGEQHWDLQIAPWHESRNAIAELTRGLRVGADDPFPGATDLSGELARIRAALTPEEGDRFRVLGRLCAEAMDTAIRAVRPGQTEHHIAGLLACEAESRGVQAIVNLVATDQRIFSYRHPLPTPKKLENYAMLILCGRKGGLVCSITRAVCFEPLPDDLRRKAEVVAQIDATLINATRPGRSLGEVFQEATLAYARGGFPDEWQLHHQGGLAGYEPREIIATPDAAERVSAGQAYAWNPSITGTKSEDTILVGGEGSELLTAIPDWPTLKVGVDGQEMERPAILEIL